MSVKASTAIDAARSAGGSSPRFPGPSLSLQFDERLVGRLDAVARFLLEAPIDEATHVSGKVSATFPNRLGVIFQNGRHERRRRITAKRPLARRQLVQHDAEREEVGAMIQRLVFDLFWRHVRHRADDDPRLCEPERGDVVWGGEVVCVNGPRQSEIEDLHMAFVGHHHIRGFEVAVDNLFPMRRRKRVGQRNRDVEEARLRQSAIRNHLAERRPLDELHRHEGNIIVFLDGEDSDDVRVVQRSDGLGFPSEARQSIGVSREGSGKNLQRHITIQFRVARAVDLAHATSAEQ
jgi:hypothetical protein